MGGQAVRGINGGPLQEKNDTADIQGLMISHQTLIGFSDFNVFSTSLLSNLSSNPLPE